METASKAAETAIQFTPFMVLILTGIATAFSTGLLKVIELIVNRVDKRLNSKEEKDKSDANRMAEERKSISEERDKARRELADDLEHMRKAYIELRDMYDDMATKYNDLTAKHQELLTDYQEMVDEVAALKLEKVKLERELAEIRTQCANCSPSTRKQLEFINQELRDQLAEKKSPKKPDKK